MQKRNKATTLRTRDYIEMARAKTRTRSDYAIARLIGASPDAIRKYRIGDRIMDNNTAARLAMALDRSVAELIAAAQLERDDPDMRAFWRLLYKMTEGQPLGFLLPRRSRARGALDAPQAELPLSPHPLR